MNPIQFVNVPTYLFNDDELIALAERVGEFANGDPDEGREPCHAAKWSLASILAELAKRERPATLGPDGSINWQ